MLACKLLNMFGLLWAAPCTHEHRALGAFSCGAQREYFFFKAGRTEVSQHLVDDVEGVVHEALVVHNAHLVQRDMLAPSLQHGRVHAQSCTGRIWREHYVNVIRLVLPATAGVSMV